MVVLPSWAVTTTVTVVAVFSARLTPELAEPDVTVAVFTVTVAPLCVVVGVNVMEVTLLATLEVYPMTLLENEGDRAPRLSSKYVRVATADPVRVTVTA